MARWRSCGLVSLHTIVAHAVRHTETRLASPLAFTHVGVLDTKSELKEEGKRPFRRSAESVLRTGPQDKFPSPLDDHTLRGSECTAALTMSLWIDARLHYANTHTPPHTHFSAC